MAETLGAQDPTPVRQFSALSTVRIAAGGAVFMLCLILGILSVAIAADDAYIAGYAAAVLQHEFNVSGAVLQVHEGVVIVTAESLGEVDRQKVLAALEKIPVSCVRPINRINLSFEEVDLKVSYELISSLRVYCGGGMLVGRDPSDLKRGTSQVGAELPSPWTFWGGKVRPVAYADFQINERSNWRVASSLMAGLQFEEARIGDRKLQMLAEYFSGSSPNGQFYTANSEWIGVGVHLYY